MVEWALYKWEAQVKSLATLGLLSTRSATEARNTIKHGPKQNKRKKIQQSVKFQTSNTMFLFNGDK